METSPENICRFRDWILNWLAVQLNVKGDQIATDQNLLTYGMDSVTAIMLVGDLENQFGLRLPPTLIWDHPSVDALVDVLISTTTESGADTQSNAAVVASADQIEGIQTDGLRRSKPIDHDEAARLLENIDQMSEDEVDALLKQLAK